MCTATPCTLDDFRALLRRPETIVFILLERLIETLEEVIPATDDWPKWVQYLRERYVVE